MTSVEQRPSVGTPSPPTGAGPARTSLFGGRIGSVEVLAALLVTGIAGASDIAASGRTALRSLVLIVLMVLGMTALGVVVILLFLALLPVERDEPVDEVRLADAVRPRDEERHLLRRVDALLGEARERHDLVLVRQPQLQPRRAQAETEERRELYCRTLT